MENLATLEVNSRVMTKSIEKEYTICGGLFGTVLEANERESKVEFDIGETIWILNKYLVQINQKEIKC